MRNIKYLDILKQAALITWKDKFLWFFGFLVFLGSIGSNFDLGGNDESDKQQRLQFVGDFFEKNPDIFVSLGLLLIVFVVTLFLLRILAIASLIRSVNDLNLYRQLSLKIILKQSIPYLKRLLLLELLVSLSLIAVLATVAMPVLYLFSLNAGVLAYLAMTIAVVIVLPLVILAHYLIKYATFYVVLVDAGLKMALESAYVVFAKNIAESLAMSLSVVVAIFCLLASALLIGIFSAGIFGLLGFLAYLIFAKIGAIVVLCIGIVTCIAILGVLFSWFTSFMYTAWLLFFQQIAFEKNGEEKVLEELESVEEVPSPEAV